MCAPREYEAILKTRSFNFAAQHDSRSLATPTARKQTSTLPVFWALKRSVENSYKRKESGGWRSQGKRVSQSSTLWMVVAHRRWRRRRRSRALSIHPPGTHRAISSNTYRKAILGCAGVQGPASQHLPSLSAGAPQTAASFARLCSNVPHVVSNHSPQLTMTTGVTRRSR